MKGKLITKTYMSQNNYDFKIWLFFNDIFSEHKSSFTFLRNFVTHVTGSSYKMVEIIDRYTGN